jgi:cell division protein FtsZ
MVFITAGMGGGTGTGAAPVIARMARERNILTVGVVTKPFTFEGSRRARAAEQGIDELQQYVDTLIVIPNQNLFRLANERTGWKEAFKMADNVLYMGVRGVTDLMVAPGLVNLDFADIRTVMAEMGKAMMGTGEADGENRAIRAAEAAISNPLLEDTSMAGARGLLINITGGEDMTLFEVDQAANRIREEVDEEANIIFGSAVDDTLAGKIRVSVVATGIEGPAQKAAEKPRLVAVGGGGGALHAAAHTVPGGASVPLAGPASMMGIVSAPPASAMPHAGLSRGPAATARPVMRGAGAAPSPYVPQPRPAQMREAAMDPELASLQSPAGAMPYDPEDYAESVRQPIASPRSPLRQTEPRVPLRSPLFADPAPVEPPAPQAPPPRKSLFGIVTGAIRGSLPTHSGPSLAAAMQDEDGAGAQSGRGDHMLPEGHTEPVRAKVRPAAGEEMGIEIPAFLRRQSS